MKVSCRWLAEYVDIKVDEESVSDLAQRLTLAGLEVEGIDYTGAISNGVLGQVLSHRSHPNSDHLSLCHVDIGDDEVEVVCGASNVIDGAYVPVVLAGGKLPGGLEIQKRKVRGAVSMGMICSKQELEMEDKSDGIWNFSDDIDLPTVGTNLSNMLEFDDYILDISVTSNRPDCLGMYGIAREVSAVTGAEMLALDTSFEETGTPTEKRFDVKIDDPADTLRYTARWISNVTIKESPLLMQHRLIKAGMRPLTNVVDTTNYVMLELGYPLHAFDGDLVNRTIFVRRAHNGENFCTLDGKARELNNDTLMIADEKGKLALAGVMGGERSEVSKDTTDVLLESAAFDPIAIRNSARGLGLRTEASHRFERGVDPEGIPQAAKRAVHLLQRLTGCVVHEGAADAYPRKPKKRQIKLGDKCVSSLLGANITRQRVKEILRSLGMEIDSKEDYVLVTIPSFREDITREVDLVEEVGRIYGYDCLPSTPPTAVLNMGERTPLERFKMRARDILVGLGLDEAVTSGFDEASWRERLSQPDDNLVSIRNPMTVGQKKLRSSLLPGLLAAVEHNLKRRVQGGMFFEVGRVFCDDNQEREVIAAVLFGRTAMPLSGKQEIDITAGKGVCEQFLVSLNLDHARFKDQRLPQFIHPGRGSVVEIDDQSIGVFGELHPSVAAHFSSNVPVIALELDLEKMESCVDQQIAYIPPPRFPVSVRDLSLLAPLDLREEEIREAILDEESVQGLLLYDLYQGEQVAAEEKSLTYEVSFRATDRTLTDDEVDDIVHRIADDLADIDVHIRE